MLDALLLMSGLHDSKRDTDTINHCNGLLLGNLDDVHVVAEDGVSEEEGI